MTIEMPARIARLPRDKHGRPIPWFVHRDEQGVPDFRVVRAHGIADAFRFEKCWVCGDRRGAWSAFVVGPMCAVNRVSAEPPSHRDCAVYSALACPFLSNPAMRRRDSRLPEGTELPAGEMITRNPGVALVWVTRDWSPFRAGPGILFRLGDPEETLWFAHGRDATRAEVLASIQTGMPILAEAAERDGRDALAELEAARKAVDVFLPPDPVPAS